MPRAPKGVEPPITGCRGPVVKETKRLLEFSLKKCGHCQQIKELHEFHLSKHWTGRDGWCKLCKKKKHAEGWSRGPGRQINLKRKYGISEWLYYGMLICQKSMCLICGMKMRPADGKSWVSRDTAVIDHCHATGKIRGLLCSCCNQAIGHIKENPISLRNAADYLEFSK